MPNQPAAQTILGTILGDSIMKYIKLTQNQVAIVDDEDFDMVSQHKWCVINDYSTFYALTSIRKPSGKRINLKMHRLILNPSGSLQVDHRDGDGLNNQRGNMRVCTNQENQYNQRPQKGKSSQYKGVSWHKQSKKWQAYIKNNGKLKHLGHFVDEIDASKAYDAAAKKLFGEFARLNNL